MFNRHTWIILSGMVLCCLCQQDSIRTGELRKACSKHGHTVQPATRVNTTNRLKELRKQMQAETVVLDEKIQAYLVTAHDDHQTEYVSEHDNRLKYISGYSGVAGVAVVTENKCVLWTDGRFHLQADEQMDCFWRLMRVGFKNIPTVSEWLATEYPNGARIGVDPKLLPESMWQKLEFEFRGKNLTLVPLKRNLIDLIWTKDRPPQRVKNAFPLNISYSGKEWTTKVEETRSELKKLGANAMIITALDEIAWLLNIRGRDIPHNPFVRSYVLLDMARITFYVNSSQLERFHVKSYLTYPTGFGINHFQVVYMSYNDVWTDLPTKVQAYDKILVPSECVFSPGASHAIHLLIPEHKKLIKPSPIINLKAVKNPTEILGMERAHIRDAVAMCKFFEYFEARFKVGDKFTEMNITTLLNEFRYEHYESTGNSFDTIAAFGTNGARPNYQTTPQTNQIIFSNSTLILNSGGQYIDGTTEITRTVHMGTPTKEQKEAYTRVLIGIIELSNLTFPENMHISQADLVARTPLWKIGLDYMHRTGHGIGSFLGVHESPITLHFLQPENQTFKPGYFFTCEPAYYSEGVFGVRLENVLEVVEKPWLSHSSGYKYLGFKVVTLVPFEIKLINFRIMSPFHIRWLNEYNADIRTKVGAELKKQNLTDAFYWMIEKTQYIPLHAQSDTISCQILVLTTNLFFIIFFT